MTSILFSSGDASGDLHTADLVRVLRSRLPSAQFFGVGGDRMAEEGVELVVHQRELAVGGFVEVLASLNRIVAAWKRLGRTLEERRPDLVVLVDSPDFNLPFARRVCRAGIPILYYVSPQVWAWRRGRIHKLAQRVDRMAVIFPFEPQIYAAAKLRVDFVGHPLLDRLQDHFRGRSLEEVRKELGVEAAQRVITLMPGSRRNELRYNLPLQLETACRLHETIPGVEFLLALAPTLHRESVEAGIAEQGLPEDLRLTLVEGKTYEALYAADVVLSKPGTNTVEVALLERPLVVAGRANPWSAAVGRRIIHVPSFTMPNLIAGQPIVPEFLQERAQPERIAEAVTLLLEGPAREMHLQRMLQVRESLGAGGAAERTATICEEMLNANSHA